MPLQHPQPPSAVAEVVSDKLRQFGDPATPNPAALGGSDPTALTMTDPHEVYLLDAEALVGQDEPLTAARSSGWRYLLSDQGEAVAAAMTVRGEGGADRFALFNRGPYVEGTVAALRDAAELPEAATEDLQIRLLTVPAVNLTAVWLHGETSDVVVPLSPAPAPAVAGRPYPASELLAALREPARALAGIGPDDETGA